MFLKVGDGFDNTDNVFGRDGPGTDIGFSIVLVHGTPEIIVMVELILLVVPASMTNESIDDAVGCLEFVVGFRESGDQDNRDPGAPGQPRQS